MRQRASITKSLSRATTLLITTSVVLGLTLGAGIGCSAVVTDDDLGASSDPLARVAVDGGKVIAVDSGTPGVDAGPFPGTCDRCPEISVTCVPNEGDGSLPTGTLAQSNSADCGIELPQSICDSQGFKTEPYTPDQLEAANQCQQNWHAGSGVSLSDFAEGCCSIRHEYGHICDPRFEDGGANPTSRCTEVFAEDSEHSCDQQVIDSVCANASSLSEEEKAQCEKACTVQLLRENYKVWDACMCGQSVATDPDGAAPSHLNSDVCCNCMADCENSSRAASLMPASCSQFKAWRAGDDDAGLAATVNSNCAWIAAGSGGHNANEGHGCGYYGGPADFSPAACGKRCVFDGQNDFYSQAGTECDSTGPFESYLYGTAAESTCEAMNTRYGGIFNPAGTSSLTVHNLSSGPSPDVTCTYQQVLHYCAEKDWKEYPDDVPPKLCAPPDTEFSCVGHGMTCGE